MTRFMIRFSSHKFLADSMTQRRAALLTFRHNIQTNFDSEYLSSSTFLGKEVLEISVQPRSQIKLGSVRVLEPVEGL